MATKLASLSVAAFFELHGLTHDIAAKISSMNLASFLELHGLSCDTAAKVASKLAEDHEVDLVEHLALLSDDAVLEACQELSLKTVSKANFIKAFKAAQVYHVSCLYPC